MRLTLTSEQSATLARHIRPDRQLLARAERQQFDGGNAETSGRLMLVFTTIPSARLDAVRAVINGEAVPPKRKTRGT